MAQQSGSQNATYHIVPNTRHSVVRSLSAALVPRDRLPRFRAALAEGMATSALANQYLADQAPWALVKTDRDRAGTRHSATSAQAYGTQLTPDREAPSIPSPVAATTPNREGLATPGPIAVATLDREELTTPSPVAAAKPKSQAADTTSTPSRNSAP